MRVWTAVASWPDAPPFAGGVFDDWPRRISQGIAFLRAETRAIEAYKHHLEAPP